MPEDVWGGGHWCWWGVNEEKEGERFLIARLGNRSRGYLGTVWMGVGVSCLVSTVAVRSHPLFSARGRPKAR